MRSIERIELPSNENLNQLRDAIEAQHGGAATRVRSVPVKETFQGRTVWEGVVEVFDLEAHPKTTRAYAWSSPIEGSDKRRIFAVLHLSGVRSPQDAVRAAIVAEHRAAKHAGSLDLGGSDLDEPPCMWAVNAVAYNRAMASYERPQGFFVEIERLPRLVRHLWPFAANSFKSRDELGPT